MPPVTENLVNGFGPAREKGYLRSLSFFVIAW